MSQTSSAFQLTRTGSKWWATKNYPSRGPVKVDCGSGTRAAAEGKATRAFYLRDIASAAGLKGGEARRKKSAARAAAPSEPRPLPPPPTAPPADPPPADPPPDPPADDPPMPAAAERSDRIRLKLLSLGDSRPIEPDAVHPPGADPRAANDNSTNQDPDDSLDNEAGELLADLIAAGVVDQHIKWIARRLKKRTPPCRPGEPNERMMDWERDGVAHYARKLFGRATALGPLGKMILGAGLVTLGCFVDAEPIAGAAPPAAASSPPAAEPPRAAPPPAAEPPRAEPGARAGSITNIVPLQPLGRFK